MILRLLVTVLLNPILSMFRFSSDLCVCVLCVVVPSILGAGFHLLGAPAGVTQEEGQHTGDFSFLFVFGSPPSFCGACLFFFYREKGSALPSLVDREVEFLSLIHI